VLALGPLFDVCQQLVIILSLAAAGGGTADLDRALSAHHSEACDVGARVTEQRWLGAVKMGISGDDIARYAPRVFLTSGGRYYVPSESDRRQLTALRKDVAASRKIVLAIAEADRQGLEARLGRSPTAGELYLAHAFGLDAAASLARTAQTDPRSRLAAAAPELAARYPDLARLRAGEAVAALTGAFARPLEGRDVEAWFRRGTLALGVIDVALEEETVVAAVAGGDGWGAEVRLAPQ
jgi:hypothetical protein